MTSANEEWAPSPFAVRGPSRPSVTWMSAVIRAWCVGTLGCEAGGSTDEATPVPETITAAPPRDKLVGCNHAGDIIDSFNGVTVYCNDAAAAGEFQCDQFPTASSAR